MKLLKSKYKRTHRTMSKTTYTPELICELREQYGTGNMFMYDPANVKKNKNPDFPTFYIPFTCVTKTDTRAPLVLQFKRQLIGASSRVAHGQKVEAANDVRVLYKLLEPEDYENSEYNTESYPVAKKAELIEYNRTLIKAFTIIHEEYVIMVEKQIVKRPKNYTLNKNKTVNSFAQYERKASNAEKEADEKLSDADRKVNADGKIKLPKPLFRIKLSVMQLPDRRIGYKTNDTPFIPLVYDVRKLTKENNFKPVPAKVLSGGRLTDLTIYNVGSFITYMSQSGGKIKFPDVCVSSSGISLSNTFHELHIAPHKKVKTETFNADELLEMQDSGLTNNDDIEETFDEPHSETFEKKTQSKKQFTEYVDDDAEPLANDDDNDDNDDDALVAAATAVKLVAKPTKVLKSKITKQLIEEEDIPEEVVTKAKPVAVKPKAKPKPVVSEANESDNDGSDAEVAPAKAKPNAKPVAKPKSQVKPQVKPRVKQVEPDPEVESETSD